MILETMRMFAGAVENETYGVNAKIDALTIMSGDKRPPPIVKVYTTADDEEAARGDWPDEWPALMIAMAAPGEADGEVMANVLRRGPYIPIILSYLTGKTGDPAVAVRDSLYTIRAILRTLNDFLHNAQVVDRQLNSVLLESCDRVIFDEVSANMLGARVEAVMTFEFRVRDELPGG